MAWTKIKKLGRFIHCPNCGGTNIVDTDYEEENADGEYEVDEDGRACEDCGWEGDDSELVSKDDDE
jgi:predicted RNA-binding Zn-ribbon protein involved in translation (DUF1610 family)